MAIQPSAGAYLERSSGILTYNGMSFGQWVYLRDRAGNAIVFKQDDGPGTHYDTWRINTSGQLQIFSSIGTATGSTVIPLNTWAYISGKRIGNNRTGYINGVSEVTLNTAETYTKAWDKIGGEYLAGSTADFSFAALKAKEADLSGADFQNEMYGYAAVMASPHTVSKFLTNVDFDNEVSGGVDWSSFGTLTTDSSTPAFLSAGGGTSSLLKLLLLN